MGRRHNLPGAGAINTITVRNDGGRTLALLTSACTSATGGATGPATATYYYKWTVYGQGLINESAPNAASAGTAVNGSQGILLTPSNASSPGNGYSAYTTGAGQTLALCRATSAGGTFPYMANVTSGVGTETAYTDDDTVTPNAGRTPPASTPAAADGSTNNDVKVTAGFYNATGIV